jgi:peptidoglycan L-alanyl-D-glutamate endopeptidase CwlK
MSFKFGQRSKDRLKGVHPDLVKVMERAIGCSTIDFSIIEGRRTLAQQKKYLAAGATRIAPYVGGKIRWDWPLYHQLAKVVKKAAAELGIPIQWGGDWRSFKDGPHWELPWKQYPK